MFSLVFTFDMDSGENVLERCSMQQITNFFLRLEGRYDKSQNTGNYKDLKTLETKSCDPYQTLLAQQTEQEGVAHLPQVLETHRLELSIFNDVLQLVVKEFQDT